MTLPTSLRNALANALPCIAYGDGNDCAKEHVIFDSYCYENGAPGPEPWQDCETCAARPAVERIVAAFARDRVIEELEMLPCNCVERHLDLDKPEDSFIDREYCYKHRRLATLRAEAGEGA